MNHRERVRAILNYDSFDRMPVVHFGYWSETLAKWVQEGHLAPEDIKGWGDGNDVDIALDAKLGFDFNWYRTVGAQSFIKPHMESERVAEFEDGSWHQRDGMGVIHLHKPEAGSIPADIDYMLKDRETWERDYKWRFEWSDDRVNQDHIARMLARDAGRDTPLGLHVGSIFGSIRNMLTMQGACYMQVDDEDLFTEIIDTVGELCYRGVEAMLATGIDFDHAHYWEDICFKNGPLIQPTVFEAKCGPHYRRIADLLNANGITITSLDCDGKIDALIPTWLSNGVNTMFPIEVGTWKASIAPWREQYGRELRGVGGMNKNVFAEDHAAVDAEIERLKRLIDLGGYIPCPDHRIPPGAEWDNVRYYCDQLHAAFDR